MEIILYIIVAFLGMAFLFFLAEYPYHLVGFFIFIINYDYNYELPGPLDLRGFLTLAFFLRIIVFDKENLNLILNLLITNRLFLLILFFGIYFAIVTYINTNSYLAPIRMFIFEEVGLLLGFITVYKGYAKKAFFSGIIFAGIFSTADLIYSYTISSGTFFNRRILDVLSKSDFDAFLNHNVFGMLIGIAIVTTFMVAIIKQINKILSFLLFAIFGIGILISTSRGTLLAVFVSFFVGLIVLPKHLIDFKKIIIVGLKSLLFFSLIIGGYLIFIKSINMDSKFADEIYYRLIEEPQSIFEGKSKEFTSSGSIKVGTIEWRMNQASRDLGVFFNQPLSTQLLGYGEAGYTKIGQKEWTNKGLLQQYASHNGFVLIIIERGLLGLFIFIVVFIYLLFVSIKSFRKDTSVFPFFIIIVFYLVFSYGAQAQLLGRFAYILFGAIIAQAELFENTEHEESLEILI